jgi:ribonuclease E
MDNDQVVAATEEAASAEAAEAPKKTARTRRKAASKASSSENTSENSAETPAAVTDGDGVDGEGRLEEVAGADAKAPARKTRSRKKAEKTKELPEADALPGLEGDSTEPGGEGARKPARRRRNAKAAVPEAGTEVTEEPVGLSGSASDAGAETPAADAAGIETAVASEETATAEDAAAHEAAEEAAAAAGADEAETEESTEESGATAPGSLFMEPVSITSMIFQAPDLSTIVRPSPVASKEAEAAGEAEEAPDGGELEDGSGRRRRRSRGRRGRRPVERAQDAEEVELPEGEAADATASEEVLEEGVTSRRRRRRRRGDQDLELSGGGDDDPPNTITRVRAPRTVTESTSSNRVASVKGSTRLEAKKQRRRESRETGRRRQVITEAEFLARRESVDRQMIVRQRDDRIQIAVLEDGVLAEHFVSKTQQDSLIGNVYLGKVQNVLPSMEAAFIDIGRGRNAVLYAGEVNWDAVTLEGQPRRIENALKSGDSVLVQVTKDPVGHKGARLTSQISLPGRYLVYVPGGSMTGISRKLPDVERNRLKRILKDRLPEDAGVIVRTAAEGASEEELTHDINRLRAQWEGIQGQSSSTKVLAPELLYGEPDLTIKVVRDVFNEDFSKLIVSGDDAWDTIEAYVTYVAPDLVGRLEKWTAEQDIFASWRIDEQIHKALERKVFLPSGGSLVIDRTEAMTVVDVNTGKFTGSGGNLEETVTKNNLEAAEEVVRQLRLRDIGGIIVIDFIDMVLESNRDLVLRRLVECLGRDRTKHQVAEVTSLGLVQMTRKRMGTGLLEVFGEQCETCAGRGMVTHDEPVEHRRANAVAAEHHHQRTEAQPAVRSERKRRRGKGGGQPVVEEEAVPAASVHPEPLDAERQAKAEATRAALANIAAAAHAAHVHEEELARLQASAAPAEAPEADAAAEAEAASAGGRPAPVLRFGGEEVALPLVRQAEETERPAATMSLDLLAEAFANLGAPTSDDGSAPGGAADGPAASPEEELEQERPLDAVAAGEAVTSRDSVAPGTTAVPHAAEQPHDALGSRARGRRGRRNRSASRAQGAANATLVEHHEAPAAASGGSSHHAEAPRTAEPSKPAGAEPIILGVGVPASEL